MEHQQRGSLIVSLRFEDCSILQAVSQRGIVILSSDHLPWTLDDLICTQP